MSYNLTSSSTFLPRCEKNLRKISRELFFELLERRESLCLKVQGGSMGYIIKDGDLITIKRIKNEELKPGDIILYNQENNFVCHRIISRHQSDGELFYITKGDVLLQADNPQPASQVIGKVFCIQRGGRSFSIEGKLARWIGYCSAWYSKLISFLHNRYGFYRSTWENPATSKLPSGLRKNFERMLRLPIKLLSSLLLLASNSSFYSNKG
jgi:hypothetical protein